MALRARARVWLVVVPLSLLGLPILGGAASAGATTVQAPGTIATFAGSVGVGRATNLAVNAGASVVVGTKMYINDSAWGRLVRVLDLTTGNLTVLPHSWKPGQGTTGLARDGGGNFYWNTMDAVGQQLACRVEKMSTTGVVTNVAGPPAGTPVNCGFSGDGGPATSAQLNSSQGLALDGAGNLYVADSGNDRIRKVDVNGIITTVAGNGARRFSGDGGPAVNAGLYNPVDVAVDAGGVLYIADTGNSRIRKVDTSGIITTLAGNVPSSCFGPNFNGDGVATASNLSCPRGVAVDNAGHVFVADTDNSRVRRINLAGSPSPFPRPPDGGTATTVPTITTVAGDGTDVVPTPQTDVGDGGPAIEATVPIPEEVTTDDGGNVYVGGGRVRKVDAKGIINTVAGNGEGYYGGDGAKATNAQMGRDLQGVAADGAGNVYSSDTEHHRVRKVDANGIISTVAGTGTLGFSGDGGLATSAQLWAPQGVAVDAAGALYISDVGNYRVRRVKGGIITTIAGNGDYRSTGDGGPATSAGIDTAPNGALAIDAARNLLYLQDGTYSGTCRLRRVDLSGKPPTISTVAGIGTCGLSGDRGAATAAQLADARAIAVDAAGNLWLSSESYSIQDCRVRKVDTAGIITTVAGTGICGFVGDGGRARSAEVSARGLAVDGAGNLYLVNTVDRSQEDRDCRVRKVSTAGIITTVAGKGTCGFSGDGGPAAKARFDHPFGLALHDGALYVGDSENHRIRRMVLG